MRIGELASDTGTTTKTLRFYEESGLLPAAARTPGGYRDYTQDAVARLDFIRRGQAAGLTLAQIRQVLQIRDDGQPPCEHVRDLLEQRMSDLDTQITELRALRKTIAKLHSAAAASDPDTCTPGQVCRYI
jgi:MerR family transcriptional regulator, Zn(II)-responsive regulator of zntA